MIKKFRCQVEGCDCHHCPKCGHHYEPCPETARAGRCDNCIVGQTQAETEAIVAAYGGNYEKAALDYNW
jgi:hypothetical protein